MPGGAGAHDCLVSNSWSPIPGPAPAPVHIALVELYRSHDEVLYPLLEAARGLGAQVTLAVHPDIVERMDWTGSATVLTVEAEQPLPGRIRALSALRREFRHRGVSHVVINTLSSPPARDLALLLRKDARVVGVVHDTRRLRGMGTLQWLARVVDGFLVLGEHVLASVPRRHLPRVTPFVPGVAPIGPAAGLPRTAGEFRVCVPGHPEWDRKDYYALVRAVRDGLDPRIRFVLLGNTGADDAGAARLRAMLEDDSLNGRLISPKRFLAPGEFSGWARACDAVLPLIHPSCRAYPEFLDYRVSGSWNVAYAAGLPLLLERGFEKHPSLHPGTMFYDVDNLHGALERAASDPGWGAALVAGRREDGRFEPAVQQARLAAALGVTA